jgi:hypothetical protein
MRSVETETNGDSRSAYERGPSLVGSLVGLAVPVQEILSCLDCSSRPRTKYFFSSPHTLSLHLSPSLSKLGRKLCRVASLLICVSGYRPRDRHFICKKGGACLWIYCLEVV